VRRRAARHERPELGAIGPISGRSYAGPHLEVGEQAPHPRRPPGSGRSGNQTRTLATGRPGPGTIVRIGCPRPRSRDDRRPHRQPSTTVRNRRLQSLNRDGVSGARPDGRKRCSAQPSRPSGRGRLDHRNRTVATAQPRRLRRPATTGVALGDRRARAPPPPPATRLHQHTPPPSRARQHNPLRTSERHTRTTDTTPSPHDTSAQPTPPPGHTTHPHNRHHPQATRHIRTTDTTPRPHGTPAQPTPPPGHTAHPLSRRRPRPPGAPAQPTVTSSLGSEVRTSGPSSRTITRSSIRTPTRPGT